MPVGFTARNVFRANGAIGARLVLDHDTLAQQKFELVGEQPGDEVGRSPGREGDHDAHQVRREILRRRGGDQPRHQDQRSSKCTRQPAERRKAYDAAAPGRCRHLWPKSGTSPPLSSLIDS